MDGSVSLVVSLNQFFDENSFIKQSLHALQRVVSACNVENGLVLKIFKAEVGSPLVEVLVDHLLVVLSDGVVDWEVAIIVFHI